MGAWGTSLYANDTASDIRADYLDKLKRGKTNEEATQELMDENRDIMGDSEEEPLFWFALADTQWNRTLFFRSMRRPESPWIR